MTPEDAKEWLRSLREAIGQLEHRSLWHFEQAIDEIDKLLEKQIPKRPDYEGDGYDDKGNLIYDTWICPHCNHEYEVEYEDYAFCPNCGQALDWSEPR